MTNLINISENKTKKIYIDADNVRSIAYFKSDDTLSINIGEEKSLLINKDLVGCDIDKIVDKIRQAGNDLVSIPDSHYNIPQYISPKFVRFMTVSESDPGVNKIGAVIGIAGFGRYETVDLDRDTLNSLIQKAEDYGIKLTKFDPDIASSRWYKPDALYMDLDSISEMNILNKLFISFDSTGPALDINIPNSRIQTIKDLDADAIKGINPVIDGYIEKAEAIKSKLKDAFNPKGDVESIMHSPDTYTLRYVLSLEIRKAFAQRIIEGNDDFIELSSKNNAIFFKKENISNIMTYENDNDGEYELVIGIKKSTHNPYPEHLTVAYPSKEDLQSALKKIENHGKQKVLNKKAKFSR